jgi:hypothetical protein
MVATTAPWRGIEWEDEHVDPCWVKNVKLVTMNSSISQLKSKNIYLDMIFPIETAIQSGLEDLCLNSAFLRVSVT